MNNLKGIKVVQYGCGKMSKYTMRYVYEHQGEIVGAIDINEKIIGKDIGEIMETENKNVKITSIENAKELLTNLKPDICIITTMSLMQDVKESLLMCASLGINAITTCEEAFYPENSSPVLTKQIDTLAKENNCTITGSGYQDAFWGNLISTLAGSTNKINKIKGSSSYNVEDYGIALAEAHGAGLTLEDFEKNIASSDNIAPEERQKLIEEGKFIPSYMWNVNGWLCDKLGLNIITQTQKCVPETSEEDLYSSTLNMTVKKGDATGMSAVVTTTTKEGITLETKCIGKIYGKNDYDKNDWTIEGEPNTNLIIQRPSTVELTCAAVVNRIPDVLKSEKGFIPTSKMGELKYMK